MSNASQMASPFFSRYRSTFEAREPNLERQKHEDELTDVSGRDDVVSLTVAPIAGARCGTPPRKPRSSGDQMHLWLVGTEDVLVALEEGPSGKSTSRGRLAHTNLSGGRPAHAGGELWFRDEASLWLTGGSSRYPPRSKEELDAIVEGFRSSGYNVCSCGWAEDIAAPARFFRGPEQWLEAHETAA